MQNETKVLDVLEYMEMILRDFHNSYLWLRAFQVLDRTKLYDETPLACCVPLALRAGMIYPNYHNLVRCSYLMIGDAECKRLSLLHKQFHNDKVIQKLYKFLLQSYDKSSIKDFRNQNSAHIHKEHRITRCKSYSTYHELKEAVMLPCFKRIFRWMPIFLHRVRELFGENPVWDMGLLKEEDVLDALWQCCKGGLQFQINPKTIADYPTKADPLIHQYVNTCELRTIDWKILATHFDCHRHEIEFGSPFKPSDVR